MQKLFVAIGGKQRVVGGPFGSKLTQADYVDHGIPVIRGANMGVEGRYIGGTFAFVSSEKVERDLRPNLAHPGDIIVTQRGTLGQVSVIPEDTDFDDFVVSQSQMAISVDSTKADRDFVYYYLRSSTFLKYIETTTIQTGVPHINLTILRDAPVNWPDKTTQRDIASILSVFDAKIELNRRTNETLEAMARAVFKSWFVDFDPVHAKAAGKAPAHMDAETAALFPDAFGDDGLPVGWPIKQLQDVLILQRGFDLPTKHRIEGQYPVFAAGGHHGYHNEFKVRGPGVVTGRSGVIGNVYIVQGDFWPLNTTLWVKEYRLGGPYFASYLLQTIDLAAFNAGSAVPTLNRNHIHGCPVCHPSPKAVEAYEHFAGTCYAKIVANEEESQTLAALRDLLLPKLMSGELRLRDAEKIVEGAA